MANANRSTSSGTTATSSAVLRAAQHETPFHVGEMHQRKMAHHLHRRRREVRRERRVNDQQERQYFRDEGVESDETPSGGGPAAELDLRRAIAFAGDDFEAVPAPQHLAVE